MSVCQDILLSFIADIQPTEDWADHFQFTSIENEYEAGDFQSAHLSCISIDSMVSSLSHRYDSTDSLYSTDSDWDSDLAFTVHESALELPNNGSKRRRKDIPLKTKCLIKKAKVSVENKLIRVVSELRKVREMVHIERENFLKHPNPISAAESFLQYILINSNNHVSVMSPSCVLHSTAISSLHNQAQIKMLSQNLCAYPLSHSLSSEFPTRHIGCGHIASAKRGFWSSISDLLSHSQMNSIDFDVSIVRDDAAISFDGHQLAAPFIWRSNGLKAAGYQCELEFKGLLRCSWSLEASKSSNVPDIYLASISFDACTVVRQCYILSSGLFFSSDIPLSLKYA